VSVRLSQAGVLSKRLNGLSCFSAQRLPPAYPTLCFKRIRLSQKLGYFSLWTVYLSERSRIFRGFFSPRHVDRHGCWQLSSTIKFNTLSVRLCLHHVGMTQRVARPVAVDDHYRRVRYWCWWLVFCCKTSCKLSTANPQQIDEVRLDLAYRYLGLLIRANVTYYVNKLTFFRMQSFLFTRPAGMSFFIAFGSYFPEDYINFRNGCCKKC